MGGRVMAWGCPVAAIVAVFAVDERTVADWLHRAGIYAETFCVSIKRGLDMNPKDWHHCYNTGYEQLI